MTFRLDHHNKILTILESLDPEVLKKGSAYFGGGTLLALDFAEYRTPHPPQLLLILRQQSIHHCRSMGEAERFST